MTLHTTLADPSNAPAAAESHLHGHGLVLFHHLHPYSVTLCSASALVSGSEPPSCLALMEWDTGRRLGPDLPEPLAMAWDPSLSLVALAYSAQVISPPSVLPGLACSSVCMQGCMSCACVTPD